MATEETYKKKIDISLWTKIVKKMMSYKKIFNVLLFTNIVIAVIDILFPILNMYALRIFVEQRNIQYFKQGFAFLITLYMLQAFLIFIFIRFAGNLELTFTHDLREECFKKLQELSFSYYDKTPVGWMISRLTSDTSLIGDIVAWNMLDIVWSGIVIVLAFISMFLIDVKLTFLIMLIFPIIFIISYYFQINILEGNRENRKINSKIIASINESINGVKTTKTLVREHRNFEEYEILTSDMKKASLKVSIYSSLYFPILNIISSIAFALIILIGGDNVVKNVMDIAALTLFINYLTQIFEHVRNLSRMLTELQRAQSAAERTFTLIESESDITDTNDVIEIYGDAFNPQTESWADIKGDIEFKNVSFSYSTGENVLNDFSLKIKAGENVALVGDTGSGKSTIVNLLCRFYEPQQGEILIDGVNIKQRSQIWLHSNLGYVLQSPHLFSGTVSDNIRFAKLDATEEEIINATKIVDAFDFIMELEDKFETDVGEGGNRLSLGQKQLISFARAIVANPSLFILDEATSSIDTETEQTIQKAITKSLEGRTSFIIAHRLSTIRFCDKILVIKDGQILEQGNHKSLLKNKGYYFNLYTNQFIEEEGRKILDA